jgi:hypothetical protein
MFFAGQSEPREQAGHRGHTHPYAPALPKLGAEFLQGGVGLLTQDQRDQLSRGYITAGLPPARVGPWSNRPRGAAPPQQVLDKRPADAKQHREGALRAAVCVIGMEDFLTKIEGVSFHIRAC